MVKNIAIYYLPQLNSFKLWYQIFIIQFGINHFFSQLNAFKYSKWLKCSIWPIDGTLTVTNTEGQRGPMINGNEGVLCVPQSSRTGTSSSYSLVSYQDDR